MQTNTSPANKREGETEETDRDEPIPAAAPWLPSPRATDLLGRERLGVPADLGLRHNLALSQFLPPRAKRR